MSPYGTVQKYSLLVLLVVLLFAGKLQAETLQARYLENSGTTSTLEIRIESPPPSSIIVKQHLPPGKQIASTRPAHKKYNSRKNVVTWLFKRPSSGTLNIVTHYTTGLSGQGARAVIHCKSPVDGSLMTVQVQ